MCKTKEDSSAKSESSGLMRGPTIHGNSPIGELYELPDPPSVVPSFFVLGMFAVGYIYLREQKMISSPENAWILDYSLVTFVLTLIAIVNMMNHIAGYLQPVPMWALYTGAFIDTWSSGIYGIIFYLIGHTPTWLVISWIFQMGVHLYYMSTGISKPENAAKAFASLMRHMRRLQTNQKAWWNTLFLYFDMMFHSVLIEVLPKNSLFVIFLQTIISYQVYDYLYNRVAKEESDERPILYVNKKSGSLNCPCHVCQNKEPFKQGCAQWNASIDQLYFDCWGTYSTADGKKLTTSLDERNAPTFGRF